MRTRRTAVAAAVVLLLVLTLAVVSAGSTTFVAVRGASMQPAFEAGDLAVLRPVESYRVGDVAGYRNQALGRVVVHRIAEVDGEVLTFQGDANSFRDPEQVRRADVVGRLSARVPYAGAVLLWLTSPFNGVLLVGAIALLVALVRRRPGTKVQADQPDDVLTDKRVVPIQDMRFPRELAITDVSTPANLLELARHYDRPVLHDAQQRLLFVVESDMLFRCRLGAAPVPSLAVVQELRPADQPWDRGDGRRPSGRGRGWDYGQPPAEIDTGS